MTVATLLSPHFPTQHSEVYATGNLSLKREINECRSNFYVIRLLYITSLIAVVYCTTFLLVGEEQQSPTASAVVTNKLPSRSSKYCSSPLVPLSTHHPAHYSQKHVNKGCLTCLSLAKSREEVHRGQEVARPASPPPPVRE